LISADQRPDCKIIMAGRKSRSKKAADEDAKATNEAVAEKGEETSEEKAEGEKGDEAVVANGVINGEAADGKDDEKADEKKADDGKADNKKSKGKKGKKSKGKTAEDATEKKEDGKEDKAKKPVKKTVPVWATVVAKAKDGKPAVQVETLGTDMASMIVRAMEGLVDDESPTVSGILLKKEVMKLCPKWNRYHYKQAILKATDKDRIKKIKNSFKLVKNPKPKAQKAKEAAGGKTKKAAKSDVKLDDLLGNIFTWVCEPKEASITLIKRYIESHHTNLDTGLKFRKAIENGILRGQLDRINGQGMSGTVQLVDQAKKTGTTYEDAIEDAVIACNEPKDASFPALRHYLSEYHTEYNVAKRPKVLLHCLERCEAKGWVQRISGKGMSGSFRLAVPYRPSPKDLWGEWYEEPEAPTPKSPRKRKVEESSDEEEEESSDEEEEEEESSEDEEEEVMPKKKQRGAPTPRKTNTQTKKKAAPPPKKKAPLKTPTKKKTPAKKTPAKKTPAKKTPAKKTSAKRSKR